MAKPTAALARAAAGGLAVKSAAEIALAFGATPEAWQIVRQQVAPPEAPDEIVGLLFARCKQIGADPLGHMFYIINRRRWNRDARAFDDNWRIEAYIDLFRSIAASSEEYEGTIGPWWCGQDGQWSDVWLSDRPPSACRVGVWRKGFREPLMHTARFDEYAQTDKDGILTGKWKAPPDGMPANMLAKCTEAGALRKAFPQKLQGIYTADEMAQADNEPVNVTPGRSGPGASTPPASAVDPAPPAQGPVERLTMAMIRTLYGQMQEHVPQAERVTLGVFLVQNEARWLKPGAKPLQQRQPATLSPAELVDVAAIIREGIAQREPDDPGPGVKVVQADGSPTDDAVDPPAPAPAPTPAPLLTCKRCHATGSAALIDEKDHCRDVGACLERFDARQNAELHAAGEQLDAQAAQAAQAAAPPPATMEVALERAMSGMTGQNDPPPTQAQINALDQQLRRLYGRDEAAKKAWLQENLLGADSPAAIEFGSYAQAAIDFLKRQPKADEGA